MLQRLREIFNTWLRVELGRGLMLTGRHLFARKVTVPGGEDAAELGPQPVCTRRYPNGEERCIAQAV
jgi:NADH-quinone oxidoreductase subunit I